MANTENNTESNTYSEQTNKTTERKMQRESLKREAILLQTTSWFGAPESRPLQHPLAEFPSLGRVAQRPNSHAIQGAE